MKLLTLAALVVSTVASVNSFAVTSKLYCGTSEINLADCRNIPQNRREQLGALVSNGNPVAIARDSGQNLYVYYTTGTGLRKCQVASSIKEYKLSANYNDRSTAYILTNDGRMMDIKMTGDVGSNCPKANKQDYNQSVRLYGSVSDIKVVSNANSSITAVGIASNNQLIISTDVQIIKKVFSSSYERDNAVRGIMDGSLNAYDLGL